MNTFYPLNEITYTAPIAVKSVLQQSSKGDGTTPIFLLAEGLSECENNNVLEDQQKISGLEKREKLPQDSSVFENKCTVEATRHNDEHQERTKIKELHISGDIIKYGDLLQRWGEYKKYEMENAVVVNMESPRRKIRNIKPGRELTITIRVYDPFIYDPGRKFKDSRRFSREIVLLGSNTLKDLRDKILCRSNLKLDVGLDPTVPLADVLSAKKKYSSGFIFIENIFYNETAKDDFDILHTWAEKEEIKPLSINDMAKTRIDDLTVRLGYPYVYRHKADCEHIVTFTGISVLTKSSFLNRDNYPYIRSIQHLPATLEFFL